MDETIQALEVTPDGRVYYTVIENGMQTGDMLNMGWFYGKRDPVAALQEVLRERPELSDVPVTRL